MSENAISSVNDPRGRRVGLAGFLIWLFALLPPIGLYAPLGVAPLLTVVAIAVVICEPRRYWAAIRESRWLIAAFVAVALWGTLTSLWSTLPGHSAFEGGRLLTITASGFAVVVGLGTLTAVERSKLVNVVAISVMVTVFVFSIDVALKLPLLRILLGATRETYIPLERFDRGTTVLGLIFWPIGLALWSSRRRLVLIGLVIATVVALVLIPSTTNRIAAVMGLLIWCAAFWWPRVATVVMLGGLIVVGLGMPHAVSWVLPRNETVVDLHQSAPWIKHSALHRLLIWRFTSERIKEHPMIGWGMDASRELPGGHENLAASYPDAGLDPGAPIPHADALPLHPHNAFLQWWVELGLPGVVLCLAIVGSLLWRIGNMVAAGPRAASLACAAAGLTIALLGYGVWQAWWMSTLWLAAALLARPFPTRL